MLRVGDVLDGKYKILSKIGHGGMNEVYLALNEKANKTWAVKEVRKDGGGDSIVVRQRLVTEEIEMLKKLHHPNIASIVDVIDRDDTFLIVMDYIEGQDLQKRVKEDGAQDPDDVIGWARQLCSVLGYLHSRKPPIIYRDMKPANVMLKPDGQIVLIDFGTAREYKADSNEEDTNLLGTKGFAAPEQFGGLGQTDARTDIYCLGTTMYYLLTGKVPTDRKILLGDIKPELAGKGIEKIVDKCCQIKREDRYQNCEDLEFDLNHVHDIDNINILKRRRRLRAFWASVAVSLVGVAGMIGFNMARDNAINGSYETYISQAQNSSEVSDKVNHYKEAIDLRPSTSKAYNTMLEDFFSDGTITQEEKAGIETCINSTNSAETGNNSNLVYFSSHNVKDYAKFELSLGQDYFAGYEGGKSDAYNAFNNALNSNGLEEDSNDYKMAASLRQLTEYEVKLSLVNSSRSYAKGDAGDGYNYADYWNELAKYTMHPDDIDDMSGGTGLSAAIYREMATQITTNYTKFKSAKVTDDDMQSALDCANTYLAQFFSSRPYSEDTYIGENSSIRGVILNAMTAVNSAQDFLSEQQNNYVAQQTAKTDKSSNNN